MIVRHKASSAVVMPGMPIVSSLICRGYDTDCDTRVDSRRCSMYEDIDCHVRDSSDGVAPFDSASHEDATSVT